MGMSAIFRRNPLRQVLFWLGIVLAVVTLIITDRSVSFVLLAVMIAAIGLVGTSTLKLTFTADEVIVRGPPTRRAPRSRITVIHVWPTTVAFVDKDDQRVIVTNSGWSKAQLVQMGEVLHVPVYDHRTLLGLSQKATGKLMQRRTQG
jgi:uncharacterized protein (DUF58 family)